MSTQKTVWITGASSGIGYALARLLCAEGWCVVASGRNAGALQALQADCAGLPGVIEPLVHDLLCLDDDGAAMASALADIAPSLDAAVFNAGDCIYVDDLAISLADARRQFEINFFAIIACLNAARPLLEKAAHPQVVMVGSLVTDVALPRSALYGASKSALDYFTRSIALDWSVENRIRFVQVRPGFVKTALTARNDFPMPFLLEPEDAARHIVRAMRRGRAVHSFPGVFHALLRLAGCLPERWWQRIARPLARSRS